MRRAAHACACLSPAVMVVCDPLSQGCPEKIVFSDSLQESLGKGSAIRVLGTASQRDQVECFGWQKHWQQLRNVDCAFAVVLWISALSTASLDKLRVLWQTWSRSTLFSCCPHNPESRW